jgi:hypothetical protein
MMKESSGIAPRGARRYLYGSKERRTRVLTARLAEHRLAKTVDLH